MGSDEYKDVNEHQNEQEDEDYSFLNETVKDPPPDMQKVLLKFFGIVGAAVLFGVVAALVFYAVLSQRNSMSPSPVTIPSDEQISQAVGSVTGSNNDTPENGVSVETDSSETDSRKEKEEGVDTDSCQDDESLPDESFVQNTVLTPMPTPTEEELDQNALDTYARVQSKLRNIADEVMKSVVTVTGVTSDDEWFDITSIGSCASSGLIVADNSVSYLILTNGYVGDNAEKIVVTLPDETLVEGSVQKQDPVTGMCIVSIPKDDISSEAKRNLQVAVLGNSYTVDQGESILAVGAPMGAAGSFVCGRIVSLKEAVAIIDGEYRLISTDIYAGSSSSGVLVNMDGEVVGFIAQQYAGNHGDSVTAIPISPIKSLIEKLSNNSALSYIGIHGLDISDKTAEIQKIPAGVYVSSIDEDSPARQAGIQPGDIITSVGLGTSVTLRSLHENIMSRSPGEDLDIVIMRQGTSTFAEFEFTVTIGELPESIYGTVREEAVPEESKDESTEEEEETS